MTKDGDDNCAEEGSMGEKRCLDRGSYGEEETRTVRLREEDDSVSTDLCLVKRKINGRKNQEKPTYYHNNAFPSSSSSSSLSSLVSQEPIRAEPIREVKPEWLVNLMRSIKGVDAKLVIDKMIQTSDVNANQGRLLIPFNQIIEMHFLNEAELNVIDDHQRDNNNNNKGLDVIVVASDGTKWNTYLRRWNMTCPNYALCSGWNDFVRGTDLKNKVGQILRLWSFHSQDGTKLYLAFFHQPPARELSLCEVALRRLPKIPTRSRTPRVCVPSSPPRVSKVIELNISCVPEMTPLEAVQELHDRTM